MQYKTQK